MTLAQQLDLQLKEAMKAHDKARVQCIRQVRSKVQEAVNAPGFTGAADDDSLFQRVIQSYVKQLEKSVEELKAGGSRSATLVAQYQAEVSYLVPFLPKPLGDAELRAWVTGHLQAHGPIDPRQGGKVLGAMMKAFPGKVDAKRAKVLVDEALQGASGATP